MRPRTCVVTALIAAAALSMALTRRQPESPRASEILTRIVELRHQALEDLKVRMNAGLVGHDEYGHTYQEWADARVRLARAQGDSAAEREALTELLSVLKAHAEQMAQRQEAHGAKERIDAEVAVLECELRLARLSRREQP